MNVLPNVLRELVYAHASPSERRYWTTGDVGWVLHRPSKFHIAFLMRLKKYLKPETLQVAAAKSGRLDIVLALRKQWAEVSRHSLRAAAKRGHVHVLRWLLTHDTRTKTAYCLIRGAVKHERVDVLELAWNRIRNVYEYVRWCCTYAKPQLLTWLAQRTSAGEVLHATLCAQDAVRVSQWILTQYFALDKWYTRGTELIAATCAHSDDAFLRATGTWHLATAANCNMLDLILQHTHFSEKQWIKQSRVAVELNDAKLFARCAHTTNDRDSVSRAVELGNWDIVRRMDPDRARYFACAHKNLTILRKLPGATRVVPIHRDIDVYTHLLRTQGVRETDPVFMRQLACILRAGGCVSAFVETDNVFWFAQRVARDRNAVFYSWLVLLCVQQGAYNCLAWLKDNAFMNNLVELDCVSHGGYYYARFSARRLQQALDLALRRAPRHVRARFRTRLWPFLACMLPVVWPA